MADTILKNNSMSSSKFPGADSPVRIYALGGLGEVGKNCYCVENDADLVILDSGVKFPDYTTPGVNYIIPDFTHLKEVSQKIRALVITHGHEDHIGSIPFLLQMVKVPLIYASKLACSLIRHKLTEYHLTDATKLIEIDDDSDFYAGSFRIRFYRVTHSIPDAYGVLVNTPQGSVATTGDFKIDLTPVDHDFNLSRLTRYGDEGIDLMMADSTNAEREGYTESEKNVQRAINETFRTAPGRLIISTFASNISRITQIATCAIAHGRKICVMGRSMEGNLEIARELGFIKIPDSSIVGPETLKRLPASQVCIICTGSQGEPMAALSRMAAGQHKYIRIEPGDTIVFSSNPIPGNTASVNKVVDDLCRAGANVLTNSPMFALHSSGHASRQELRLLQKLARPRYFMPIHGEYRMLLLNAAVGVQCGLPEDHTFVMNNGDTIIMYNHECKMGTHIPCDALYVDGKSPVGVASSVICDRNLLINEGVVGVFVSIDPKTNRLLFRPTIETRGLIAPNKQSLTNKAEEIVEMELESLLKGPQKVTYSAIKDTIRQSCSHFIFRETHRNPMIVPVVSSLGSTVLPTSTPKTPGFTAFARPAPVQPKNPEDPGREGR